MQLFTGSRRSVDAIIMQEDTNSEAFFKKIDNLFSISEDEISDQEFHSIELGKGSTYLVFKLQSRPYLYLMATCQYD